MFNSCLKLFPRKLKSRWFDPFTAVAMFPHGALEVGGISELEEEV